MPKHHAGAKHGRHDRYHHYYMVVVVIVCVFWFSLFFFSPSRITTTTVDTTTDTGAIRSRSPCDGKYVYIHDLPSKFNSDMLRHCRTLSKWKDMCLFTTNSGLGPELEPSDVFPYSGWYATNQFALDVVFHNRMNHYKCLTNDSSRANAIFVPFYAGLDVGRYLWGYNTSVRDSTSSELVRWLRSRPEWEVMGGRDHFVIAGRITWDFRRFIDDEPYWGNKFLHLPEVKNMTTLVVEASPWHSNDVGIPYPTYFHPKDGREVLRWQERVRGKKRKWLFSFAGGPRPNRTESIRGWIIEQCRSSRRCSLLECHAGASKCHSPSSVMRLFQNSVFCLQPPGDSYTRRSAFDAMVAGCVPVFFHPGSAYVQYPWHLPRDYSRYSVFISEEEVREGNVRSIEEVLDGIEEEKVKAMREEVIQMIPRLVYADPRSKLLGMKDAFDLAVDGMIERVEGLRKEKRGAGELRKFQEHNSWKYGLMGNEEPHEWDLFFFKPSSRLM